MKYLLWGLIDPIGKIIYENKHASVMKISDLTDIFSLSIKAETPSSISMTLAYRDGVVINNSSEDYQYHSSLKNVLTYVRFFTHVIGHSSWTHFIGNCLI